MNNKPKIIVYGLGQKYIEYKESIDKYFDVLGLSDTKKKNITPNYVVPDHIFELEYDYVLVTSFEFFDEIKFQLIQLKIEEEKIIGLLDLLNEWIRVDKGFLNYKDIKLDHNTCYVLCPRGIGDTLYVLSLAYALKETRGGQRICAIVKREHEIIPDWFEDIDEKMVSDIMVRDLLDFSLQTQTWSLDNYLYGHFKYNLQWELDPLCSVYYKKGMINTYKKCVLDVDTHYHLALPDFNRIKTSDPSIKSNSIDLFNKIILMPYANSYLYKNIVLWEYLAKSLKEMGFSLLTNCKNSYEKPICGTEPLYVNLGKLALCIDNASAVISLRSGICDILAFTKVNLIILNQNIDLYNDWNVNYACDRENIWNIQLENESIASVHNAIIEIIKKL